MCKEEIMINRTKIFFTCLKNWDYEQIQKLCKKKVSWKIYAVKPIAGAYKGIPEVLGLLEKLKHEFPRGLSFNFINIVTQYPYVAVEWSNKGIKKDGSLYKNHGMNFLKYAKDGKIEEISEIVDSSPLLEIFR